jgi:hypothetical protein
VLDHGSPDQIAEMLLRQFSRDKMRAVYEALGRVLNPSAASVLVEQTTVPSLNRTPGGRALRPGEKAELRKVELRNAVKEAERRIEDAWYRAPRDQTVDSPECQAWRATPYHQRKMHPLEAAKQQARAIARADLRARWAAEDAEPGIDLPAHITRLPIGGEHA